MLPKKQGIDIINKVLELCYQGDKDSLFIMSLMHQYEERGFLTKKQLEGLHHKASSIADMPAGWLATIEAMVAKLPNRDKSPVIRTTNLPVKDNSVQLQLEGILEKFPQHKAVLVLQSKYNKEKQLSTSDKAALDKLYKLLVQK